MNTTTPGPYRVNPINGRSIETLDGKRIAHNFYARKAGSSQGIPYEEVFGNAYLLAAAWDMRETLKLAQDYLKSLLDCHPEEVIDRLTNTGEDLEATIQTALDLAEGKPSAEEQEGDPEQGEDFIDDWLVSGDRESIRKQMED